MSKQEETKKRGRKAKVKAHEVAGFKSYEWSGVKLELDKTYWVVRDKASMANKGLTPLALAEDPCEVVEAKFLGYEQRSGEEAFSETPPDVPIGYAFDDGRLARRLEYLSISVEDREHHIYAHTKEGKKAAESYVTSRREHSLHLITSARDKDAEVAREVAEGEGITLDDLLTMAIALGGTAKTLENAGKSRKRKVEAVLGLRHSFFEKEGKAPKLAERPSTKDVSSKK